MQRLFTKVANGGITDDGKLFAGDINALQDAVAALADLTQSLQVGSVAIGESGLQIVRYGAGEARLSGALRTDGIIRALGGLYAGAYTTTQRDALTSAQRPYGLVILNTTTSRLEWNSGSDVSPNWQPLAQATTTIVGTLASRPAANSVVSGTQFFATDQVSEWVSNGTTWTRMGKQAGEVSVCLAATASAGHILLQGQAWPSTSGIYADLYARYGSPANVPDMRGYAPVGYKSGDSSFGTLLGTLGEKTHTLTIPEMPSHTHTVTVPSGAQFGKNFVGASAGTATQPNDPGGVPTIDAAGGGGSHNNIQPSKVVNFEAKL